jgi:iron complex outermembrane receptor protein
MYFDGTWRDLTDEGFHDEVRTFDLQAQHRFPLGDFQSITYGIEMRLAQDQTTHIPFLAFEPADRALPMYSGFVQDQITLVPKHLDLTLGTKLEDNIYTGLEWDPSARLAWRPTDQQTVWAAVSRAVRTPTRLDEDVSSPEIGTPNRDFISEKVIAYEMGYRVRPIEPLSLSAAAFFNNYTDVRSIDYNTSAPPAVIFANDQAANTWGFELSGDLQIATWWHLRGGYTYLDENLWRTSDEVDPISTGFEANDPYNQIVLQSLMDLPHHLQLDTVLRYVDSIQSLNTPSYISLDARLAWHYKNIELALVGQNLLDNWHQEFGSAEIPRSFYGSLTIRW